MWFNRKKKPAPAVTDPADVVRELREQALKLDVSEFPPAPQRPHVVGVMMETGYPQAVVSLVAFADGTTSLYFSTGGGIIGAGQHDVVYAAAQEFLDAAEAHLAEFAPADATPPPDEGRGTILRPHRRWHLDSRGARAGPRVRAPPARARVPRGSRGDYRGSGVDRAPMNGASSNWAAMPASQPGCCNGEWPKEV
jgi:hypothetical protein